MDRNEVHEVATWMKDAYRGIHSGGCRLLSKGDGCGCFLCQVDGWMRKKWEEIDDERS